MGRGSAVSAENPLTPEGEADEYFCPICGIGLAQSNFDTPEKDYYCPSAAREIGVTRERIRQIEAKTLSKLRHPSRARKLRDYLA